ncbi:hypothetical protein AB0D08_10720 [Kitasatospora sp. NPDC048540]|uniref:hypothetical protein n=1 Tax=unclassified Kitasatospora TaxID=2633591 RepID=UPI000A5F0DFA|nr:hypothetical protein [Kitasatospora sp. MBT63]
MDPRPQHPAAPLPQPRPAAEADEPRHREQVRRLGAKYAACHADLLRRLGE